jgi:PKD repeat protein/predicted GH43/DUF377 family glycosyl hydrolase
MQSSGWSFEWVKKGVVVDVGAPGEPDDVSASTASIIYDNGTYKVWYSAYDGSTWTVMYAESSDGLSFTKYGVVMEPGQPGDMDDDWARDPNVLKNDQGFYEMWYTGQKKNVYGWRILYATSADGVNWQKHGVVWSRANKAVGHPHVLIDGNGAYRMWYSEYDMANWRIRHATSADGENWVDDGLCIDIGPPGAIDAKYVYGPSVIVEPDGTYVMFFANSDGNPSGFVNTSLAVSSSGNAGTWIKQGITLEQGLPGEPDDVQATSPAIMKGPDDLHRLYYFGYDGTFRRFMLAIELGQIPPEAVLGSNAIIDEGGSVTIDATGSRDADGFIVKYHYDFGDGTQFTYEPLDGVPILVNHKYGDDGLGYDGVYTVVLTVTDDQGLTSSDSMVVTVVNVDPSLSVSTPTEVNEGSGFTASIEVTDPGSDDLTVIVDWGDGITPSEIVSLNDPLVVPDPYPSPEVNPRFLSISLNHMYGDDGTYTVTVTASDDDGGETIHEVNINVLNSAPSISSFGPFATDEGSSLTVAALGTDPGSDDLFFEWLWEQGAAYLNSYFNDGTNPDPYPSPQGIYPFSKEDSTTFTYGDDGNYTITLSLEDDDGGVDVFESYIIVNNIAPTILSLNFSVSRNFPRTVGYWGHQCEVENPYGDHTGILAEWVSNISSLSTVFSGLSAKREVCDVIQHGDASDMLIMAKRQLLGVWLNLVSGKVDPSSELLMQNLTASTSIWEAVLEIEDVIMTPSERDELERVKDIADNINNGIGIAMGFAQFTASASDPGSDDLTFTWDFGDGTSLIGEFFSDGSFPTEVSNHVSHSYFSSGQFVVTLIVEDDDGGSVTVSVIIVV